MTFKPEIFYILPGLGHELKDYPAVTHDRAFYTTDGVQEERDKIKLRGPAPVTYGLTRKTKPKTGGLVTPTSFWVLFDQDNGSYHEHKDGWAWVFLFATREKARDYAAMLEQQRKDGMNVINVAGPFQYFIQ
jgi:hypothetical protein